MSAVIHTVVNRYHALVCNVLIVCVEPYIAAGCFYILNIAVVLVCFIYKLAVRLVKVAYFSGQKIWHRRVCAAVRAGGVGIIYKAVEPVKNIRVFRYGLFKIPSVAGVNYEHYGIFAVRYFVFSDIAQVIALLYTGAGHTVRCEHCRYKRRELHNCKRQRQKHDNTARQLFLFELYKKYCSDNYDSCYKHPQQEIHHDSR